jgi:transcriptional regulator with XRE-family HTH domain
MRNIPLKKLANAPTGYTTIGERIQLCREIRKWLVSECAAAIGISARLWRAWERGGMPKKYAHIIKLSIVLGVDIDWLMGRSMKAAQ